MPTGRTGDRPAPSASRSATASSIAIRVPDPTEKCAVCAASPSSTTLPLDHGAHADGRKLPPDAPVRDQPMPVELLGEQRLEKRGRFCLVGLVQAGGAPRLVAAFDDERRAIGLVLVGVDAPQAVLVRAKVERELGKRLASCRARRSDSAGRRCSSRIRASSEPPHRAVDAVGADDQIGAGEIVERSHLALELESHARGLRLLLQRRQQRVTAHAAEAVAGRDDGLAARSARRCRPSAPGAARSSRRPPSRPRRCRPSSRRRTPRRSRTCRRADCAR